MARFFKYKSIEELEAENARLGIDLRFSNDLAPLLQPLTIGPRTMGNRWCIHPMEGCDGELDGRPGELTFRRYHRFGDGGAKMMGRSVRRDGWRPGHSAATLLERFEQGPLREDGCRVSAGSPGR